MAKSKDVSNSEKPAVSKVTKPENSKSNTTKKDVKVDMKNVNSKNAKNISVVDNNVKIIDSLEYDRTLVRDNTQESIRSTWTPGEYARSV